MNRLTSFFGASKAQPKSTLQRKNTAKSLDLTDVNPTGFYPFYLFELDQESEFLESDMERMSSGSESSDKSFLDDFRSSDEEEENQKTTKKQKEELTKSGKLKPKKTAENSVFHLRDVDKIELARIHFQKQSLNKRGHKITVENSEKHPSAIDIEQDEVNQPNAALLRYEFGQNNKPKSKEGIKLLRRESKMLNEAIITKKKIEELNKD